MARNHGLTRPEVVRRIAEGYGSGVYKNFRSFHQVTRGDLPSRGLSSVDTFASRSAAAHLLSNAESVCSALASMVPDVDDIRWQVLLSWYEHLDERVQYLEDLPHRTYPGTSEIAAALSCRHPLLREATKEVSLWPMTTDLVLTIRPRQRPRRILAVSVKADPVSVLSKRSLQLLRIDRLYWTLQGHEWMLLTPEVIKPRYVEAVVRYAAYARGTETEDDVDLSKAANIARTAGSASLSGHLESICEYFGCTMWRAQGLFWQAVWRGMLPIALEDALWATQPIRVLPLSKFLDANPICARRSAWKD